MGFELATRLTIRALYRLNNKNLKRKKERKKERKHTWIKRKMKELWREKWETKITKYTWIKRKKKNERKNGVEKNEEKKNKK